MLTQDVVLVLLTSLLMTSARPLRKLLAPTATATAIGMKMKLHPLSSGGNLFIGRHLSIGTPLPRPRLLPQVDRSWPAVKSTGFAGADVFGMGGFGMGGFGMGATSGEGGV